MVVFRWHTHIRLPLSKKQPSLLVNAVGHTRVVSYDSIKWKSIYIKKIEKF